MEQNNGTPPAAPDMTGTGYLIVQVTTARGAIPLEGAKVDIRSYEAEDTSAPETRGDVIASLTSGRDGNTPRVSLPTPPRAASESPGNIRPCIRPRSRWTATSPKPTSVFPFLTKLPQFSRL